MFIYAWSLSIKALELWCLTLLSTLYQLNPDGQFYLAMDNKDNTKEKGQKYKRIFTKHYTEKIKYWAKWIQQTITVEVHVL
jgi:hypothetical protein